MKKRLTTEDLFNRYRKRHEATMSGNVGAFTVPLGAPMMRRTPTPPYEKYEKKRSKKARKKKR